MLNIIGNKRSLIVTILFFFIKIYAQTPIEKCNINKSHYENIYSVTAEDIKCLAKNSDQPNTIFQTFGSWCVPCVYHLPHFFTVEMLYQVDAYVILVDQEESDRNYRSREHIYQLKRDSNMPIDTNILVIKDLEKGGKNKKYKDFLSKITPSQLEVIDDMSKYIILNQQGEVQLVTSWKDSENDPDWKNDKPMIQRKVIPLLQKKEKK